MRARLVIVPAVVAGVISLAAPAFASSVTVAPGDTLSQIAVDNGTTVSELAALNSIPDVDLIYVGQVLQLSGERPESVSTEESPTVETPTVSDTPSGGFEQCVIARESEGEPQVWNASGHWGLYQFSYSTWVANGGSPGDFGSASAAEQHEVFVRTSPSAWAPYDGC